LFSVLVEDAGLASTALFSAFGALGEASLALLTDIVFLKGVGATRQHPSGYVRDSYTSLTAIV
jgi:hypothetical protein